MSDVFTPAKRSEVMACIRGRGNKDTELALLKLLRAARITGWRRHVALPGRPDFTFRRERLVVLRQGDLEWRRQGAKPRSEQESGRQEAMERERAWQARGVAELMMAGGRD